MGAQIKAVPGWGEYFSKVYLLRPKIRCNSPHSRPVGVSPTWERARGVQDGRLKCRRQPPKLRLDMARLVLEWGKPRRPSRSKDSPLPREGTREFDS